jgi:hypothetical protein
LGYGRHARNDRSFFAKWHPHRPPVLTYRPPKLRALSHNSGEARRTMC